METMVSTSQEDSAQRHCNFTPIICAVKAYTLRNFGIWKIVRDVSAMIGAQLVLINVALTDSQSLRSQCIRIFEFRNFGTKKIDSVIALFE